MATDLYVLYQTDASIPPKKRRKQSWFGNEESDTPDQLETTVPELKVVVGQGDVYVNLVTGQYRRYALRLLTWQEK